MVSKERWLTLTRPNISTLCIQIPLLLMEILSLFRSHLSGADCWTLLQPSWWQKRISYTQHDEQYTMGTAILTLAAGFLLLGQNWINKPIKMKTTGRQDFYLAKYYWAWLAVRLWLCWEKSHLADDIRSASNTRSLNVFSWIWTQT